jgi:glycosyltransferase involved in cell wall biosynthesis
MTKTVSIYFYTGDFEGALRRYRNRESQVYATHDEIARLCDDLQACGIKIRINSFVSHERTSKQFNENVRIDSLGAKGLHSDSHLLVKAIEEDKSDVLIPHFPNISMLSSCIKSRKRCACFLANTYNRYTPRTLIQIFQTVRLLNNEGVELVSNHCFPATAQLARYGVNRAKLIAWDVPHGNSPQQVPPKTLRQTDEYVAIYVGSVSEEKGAGDAIEAIAKLDQRGMNVRLRVVGGGAVDAMRALAERLAIAHRIDFAGVLPNDLVNAGFREADIALIPSRTRFSEGFPLTMFEAIASRTPIACSMHPVFRWVMTDGENAAMFSSGNSTGLANAIHRVLGNKALYAKLSQGADASWERLSGAADWRKLIANWVTEGKRSPWIAEQLAHQQALL